MEPQAVPENLFYTKTHEWVRSESDGSVTVGITQHAQSLLGDMVYVELPELHKAFRQGAEIAVLESVKAAADVYAPVAGKIIAVNTALNAEPQLINQAPYDAGWLCRILPENPDFSQLSQLLKAAEYATLIQD